MSDTITIDTTLDVQPSILKPLSLLSDNHPMLRTVMPEYDVTKLPNSNMSTLVSQLKMTMKLYGGIGLSANQCGIMERVFIIGTDEFTITCINPKVVNHSNEIVKDNEGCLSFPGMFLKLDRPKSIDVEFYDESGKLQQMTLDGLTARCYLHELDHMNGVRFVDRVGPVAIRMAQQRKKKLLKKYKRGNV